MIFHKKVSFLANRTTNLIAIPPLLPQRLGLPPWLGLASYAIPFREAIFTCRVSTYTCPAQILRIDL